MYMKETLIAANETDFSSSPHGLRASALARGMFVVTQRDRAFPTGIVTLVMLVPAVAQASSSEPCTTLRAREFGRLVRRLSNVHGLNRNYRALANIVRFYTSALVFVRAGSRQLASNAGAGPSSLRNAGTTNYDGYKWLIDSFLIAPGVRVYVLAPPAPTAAQAALSSTSPVA
jgi:hypothetical protein